MTFPSARSSWLVAGAAALLGGLAPAAAHAQAAPATQAQPAAFAIPAQPLGDALVAFGRQSGWQVAVDPALVAGRSAPAVSGALSPETALARLLDGSGLIWRRTADASVVVERVDAGGAMVLGQVSVQGQSTQVSPDPDATEGSRAYAVKRASVGQKAAVPLKEIPRQVTVIPHARIEEENFTRLEDAMRTATGVTVLPTDAGRGAIFVRGFELDNYLIDGLPASVSSIAGSQPDMFMFDRVEILRGPAGLFGGASEPGATVNLARKRALAEPGGTASVSVGSWSAYRGEMDVTSALNRTGTVRGRLVAAYDTRQSYVDQVESEAKMVYGTVEADLTPDTTLSLAFSHDEKDKLPNSGLPAYADGSFLDVSRSTFVGADWNRFDSSDDQALVELQHRLASGGEIKGAVRVVDRDADMKYALSGSTVNAAGVSYLRATEIHFREQGIASDLHVTQPVEAFGLTHTLTAGVDFRRTDSRTRRGNTAANWLAIDPTDPPVGPSEPTIASFSNSESELNQGGLYGEARIKPLRPLTLIFGGRFSAYDLDVTDAVADSLDSKNETGVFTPFAAAVYDLTESLAAYVSYAETFQPQTETTQSGGIIDPRESRQVEVGLKGQFLDDRLNGQIGVYRLVDTNRAMADPDDTNASISAGKVVVKGVDAEISGSLSDTVEVFAGYAYVLSETRVAASGIGSTFSNWTPKHTANLRVRYSFDEGALDDLWVAGGARYVSSYYGQNAAGTRWTQDGYALFDLQAGYPITENVSASLTLNNLFDKTYYVRAGSNGSVFNYYGEPFNATFKITATF